MRSERLLASSALRLDALRTSLLRASAASERARWARQGHPAPRTLPCPSDNAKHHYACIQGLCPRNPRRHSLSTLPRRLDRFGTHRFRVCGLRNLGSSVGHFVRPPRAFRPLRGYPSETSPRSATSAGTPRTPARPRARLTTRSTTARAFRGYAPETPSALPQHSPSSARSLRHASLPRMRPTQSRLLGRALRPASTGVPPAQRVPLRDLPEVCDLGGDTPHPSRRFGSLRPPR